jgi:hypothetical protein
MITGSESADGSRRTVVGTTRLAGLPSDAMSSDTASIRARCVKARVSRASRSVGGLARAARVIQQRKYQLPANAAPSSGRVRSARSLRRRSARVNPSREGKECEIEVLRKVEAVSGYQHSEAAGRRLLGIYLNDHLAGATAGTELARRAAASQGNAA